MGVLVLFAMLSRQLGFILDSVQAAFPDLLARMEVQPGRWQPVRIEVEYLSSSFRRHGHDARQCDLIVCWRHDWKNCPPNLQAIEQGCEAAADGSGDLVIGKRETLNHKKHEGTQGGAKI